MRDVCSLYRRRTYYVIKEVQHLQHERLYTCCRIPSYSRHQNKYKDNYILVFYTTIEIRRTALTKIFGTLSRDENIRNLYSGSLTKIIIFKVVMLLLRWSNYGLTVWQSLIIGPVRKRNRDL